MSDIKILLGLTTTPGSDWREKIKEIDEIGIKEVALFPTFLKLEERKELYARLEDTGLKSLPHVHLRDDMEKWEVDLFWNKYSTRLFNIHSRPSDEIFLKKIPEYKKNIFVENGATLGESFFRLAGECGGFCFDVSHYHDFAEVQDNDNYKKLLKAFEKNKVGCCHISSVANRSGVFVDLITGRALKGYSFHYLKNLEEIEYIENYIEYLPEVVSIELENSFKEQIKIRSQLKKIISRGSF